MDYESFKKSKIWQQKFWSKQLIRPLRISILSTIISLLAWSIISLLFLRDVFVVGVFATTFISLIVSYVISVQALEYRNQLEEARLKTAVEQQRVKILATFIQNAAHEFKTPLTVIRNSTYLISRITDAEKQKTQRQKIIRSVDTINKLVDHMLHLTKLEMISPSSYELQPVVHLDTLLTIVETDFQQKVQDKPVTLTIDLAPDLPPIYCHQDDWLFALQEILTNAAQSINETGTISIKIRQEGSWIKIQVQDDGEGMKEAVLERIFEPFYRKDESHTSSGMGLGLSISRRIIALHQGTIQIESESGLGTCVTILLPVRNTINHN